MIQQRKTSGIVWFLKINIDGTAYEFALTGWTRWALESLIYAGRRGCSCFSHPAQNWSVYILHLRGLGMQIETHIEPHFGDFPGTHARYVLADKVVRLK